MKFRLLIFLNILFFLCVGCRTAPLKNYEYNWPNVNNNRPYTMQQVRSAILKGCADKNWTARDIAPNIIEARIIVRQKHEVKIRIIYSTNDYALLYDSSTNMKYTKKNGVPYIHSNYNVWLNNLDVQIRHHLIENSYNPGHKQTSKM